MRNFLFNNASVFQRLDQVELKQLKTAEKLDQIFKALEAGKPEPSQGIFYDGQIFDAYTFTSNIIRRAKNEIILIDNYIDEVTLTHLAKKSEQVKVRLYTKTISKQINLDLKKVNEQYAHTFEIIEFKSSHDRGSADFSGEQDKLGEDFHESKEEVFGVCNASKVGTK
jgi:hypothetical protein